MQIVIVTGGSQAIGKTVVELLCLEGATVYFCSRRPEQGEAVAKAINDSMGMERAFYTRVDVSDSATLKAWIDNVGEKEGRIDVMVPNAAAFVFGTIDEVGDDDWDRILAVNVKVSQMHGFTRCCCLGAPSTRKCSCHENLSHCGWRCVRRATPTAPSSPSHGCAKSARAASS